MAAECIDPAPVFEPNATSEERERFKRRVECLNCKATWLCDEGNAFDCPFCEAPIDTRH